MSRLVARSADAEDLSGTAMVAVGGEVLAEAFQGVADPATSLPPGPATRFGTASITKMFTAAAIARLVDGDAFGFQTRVADLLPADWYPRSLHPTATLHHLLTHCSGLPDYIPDDPEDGATVDLWAALGGAEIRDAAGFLPILAALPLGRPPTATALYCNAGYVVLGLVLEAVTGHSFQEVIAAEVLEPAGMGDSAFLALDRSQPDVAIGMLAEGGSNSALLPVAGSPDGGAYSTGRDLVRFLEPLHHGDLLAPASRRAVLTRWADSASGETGYGYGQKMWERGGRYWCGHTGGDPGVSACAFHSPSDRVSLVVLSNRSAGGGAVWRRVADELSALS